MNTSFNASNTFSNNSLYQFTTTASRSKYLINIIMNILGIKIGKEDLRTEALLRVGGKGEVKVHQILKKLPKSYTIFN